MSTLKKRTRLAAVATATLSGASIFALATPAHATSVAPEPISQADSSATGGTSETITVKFNSNASGEPASFYVAELYYFDGTNAATNDPTDLPYFGGQTGMTAQTLAVDGVNTITFNNVPDGNYKVLIWAHNAFGKSSGSDGATLWTGGRTPASPAADKAIEVSTTDPGGQAPIPNFTAFRPYSSWEDMLQNEYKLWTGHNKKGAEIVNGRAPRDDEYTFWRYFIAGQNLPSSWIDTIGVTDTSLNPDAAATIDVLRWTFPNGVEAGKYNTYFNARLTWLRTDPNPATDLTVTPPPEGKAKAPHAPGDTNRDGLWSKAELEAMYNTASTWAYNDVFFDRREVWAAWMAEEAAQTDGPAIRLYTAYFGSKTNGFEARDPDYGGTAFWSNRLRSGGTLLGISEFFLDSDEFEKRLGGKYDTYGTEDSVDAAEFVALIYRNVLGRNPDGSGFSFWTRQLQTERYSPAEVLIGFSESHEFRDRVHARTNAASVYAHLLGRMPTATEYVLDSVYSHFFVDNPGEVNPGFTGVSGYERLIDLNEFKTRIG